MTGPKIQYAGQGEKVEKKEARAVDPAVQAVLMRTTDPRVRDMIEKVARAYDLPAHGITVLGGSPYVNVTGLDERIQQKWLSKGWIKSETARMIQYADKENNHLAGCKVIIEFFHPKAFNENLKMLRESMSAELLKGLRETHTVIFTSEGWASPNSCQAIAYDYVWSKEAGKKVPGELLVENVNMMAERKASNRAKRAAVGCGLTSVEEVIGKDSVVDVVLEETKDIPPEKIKKAVKKGKEERERKLKEINELARVPKERIEETLKPGTVIPIPNGEKAHDLTEAELLEMSKIGKEKETLKPGTVVPTDKDPREMTPEEVEKAVEKAAIRPEGSKTSREMTKAEMEEASTAKTGKPELEHSLFFVDGNTISTVKKQKLMELYGSVPEASLRLALDQMGCANPIEVKTDKQAGQLIYALTKEEK